MNNKNNSIICVLLLAILMNASRIINIETAQWCASMKGKGIMKEFIFTYHKDSTGKYVCNINGKNIITYKHPSNPTTLENLMKNNVKGYTDLRSVNYVSSDKISVNYV